MYELEILSHATGSGIEIELKALAGDEKIYYTTDGEAPTQQSNLYENPFSISSNATIKAQAFLNGNKIGRGAVENIQLHKAAGKSISLKSNPSPIYSSSGNTALINGIAASAENFNDGEWLGFNGDDLEAIIDLGKLETLDKVKLQFFNGPGSWIYLPKEVHIFSSDNGTDFINIGTKKNITGVKKTVPVTFAIEKSKGRYLKVIAKNLGVHPEYGEKVWLFVDEIVVE